MVLTGSGEPLEYDTLLIGLILHRKILSLLIFLKIYQSPEYTPSHEGSNTQHQECIGVFITFADKGLSGLIHMEAFAYASYGHACLMKVV
jgi:hypothetical protein